MVGSGVKPWLVPTAKLATTLRAVQRLLRESEYDDSEAIEDGPEQDEQDEGSLLYLLDVRSTSAAYRVGARDPDRTIGVIRQAGVALEDSEHAEWKPKVLSSIKDLSEVAKSLGCNIEFRLPGQDKKLGDVIARIQPTSFDLASESAFVYGHTTVYGKIERVGGASSMHCGLRVPDQANRMIICKVGNGDLVRSLGQFIYQDVLVSGNATWYRRDWILKTIEITGYENPKRGSLLKALDEARKAGADVWDNFDDPHRALMDTRG